MNAIKYKIFIQTKKKKIMSICSSFFFQFSKCALVRASITNYMLNNTKCDKLCKKYE